MRVEIDQASIALLFSVQRWCTIAMRSEESPETVLHPNGSKGFHGVMGFNTATIWPGLRTEVVPVTKLKSSFRRFLNS